MHNRGPCYNLKDDYISKRILQWRNKKQDSDFCPCQLYIYIYIFWLRGDGRAISYPQLGEHNVITWEVAKERFVEL